MLFVTAVAASLHGQGIDFNAANAAEQIRWGVLGYHRGLFNEAIVSFEKALSLDSANALARMWLGRALYSAGYLPEALQQWGQLASAGMATELLRDQLEALRNRTGIGPQIAPPTQYVPSVSLDGNSPGGHSFGRPTAVRPLPDGTFLVVAFGSNEVLHYDANMRLIAVFNGGVVGFDRPYDALDAGDGTFFISEYGANRVVKLNSRGERVATFGEKLSAPPSGRAPGAARASLLGPQYLAADGRGYLWVTDWGNARAVKFDLDGRYVLSIEGLGGPSGIAAREGRVFVSERDRRRVSVFDLNGNWLSSLGDGIVQAPEGLSFAADGRLLVADGGVLRAADVEQDAWSVVETLSGVARRVILATEGVNGDILASDFDGSKVVMLAPAASLYTGLWVRIERVNAVSFPEVFLEVSVEDRAGRPVVGLRIDNLIVTEDRVSVGRTEMAPLPAGLDVALLVERSPATDAQGDSVAQEAEDLWSLVTPSGRIAAVSAGAQAVRETDYGETRLRFRRAAQRAVASAEWQLDAGVRLAADGLITQSLGARRAIVFFTGGGTGKAPWRSYSLTELAAYLRVNEIPFFPVVFGEKSLDEDLAFLAAETGGRGFNAATPGGMADIVAAMRARVSSRYLVHYASPSRSDFGQRYIPLEVEASVQRKSGRDEAGYFGPSR